MLLGGCKLYHIYPVIASNDLEDIGQDQKLSHHLVMTMTIDKTYCNKMHKLYNMSYISLFIIIGII